MVSIQIHAEWDKHTKLQQSSCTEPSLTFSPEPLFFTSSSSRQPLTFTVELRMWYQLIKIPTSMHQFYLAFQLLSFYLLKYSAKKKKLLRQHFWVLLHGYMQSVYNMASQAFMYRYPRHLTSGVQINLHEQTSPGFTTKMKWNMTCSLQTFILNPEPGLVIQVTPVATLASTCCQHGAHYEPSADFFASVHRSL